MASDLEVVEQLERELLTSAVRADRHRVEQLLHPEFVPAITGISPELITEIPHL